MAITETEVQELIQENFRFNILHQIKGWLNISRYLFIKTSREFCIDGWVYNNFNEGSISMAECITTWMLRNWLVNHQQVFYSSRMVKIIGRQFVKYTKPSMFNFLCLPKSVLSGKHPIFRVLYWGLSVLVKLIGVNKVSVAGCIYCKLRNCKARKGNNKGKCNGPLF